MALNSEQELQRYLKKRYPIGGCKRSRHEVLVLRAKRQAKLREEMVQMDELAKRKYLEQLIQNEN